TTEATDWDPSTEAMDWDLSGEQGLDTGVWGAGLPEWGMNQPDHNPDHGHGHGDGHGDGWMVGNGPGLDAFALPGADGQADWAAITRDLLGLGSEEEVIAEHHEQAQRLLADLSLQAPPPAPPADPTLTTEATDWGALMDWDPSTEVMDWDLSGEQGLDNGVWGAGLPQQGTNHPDHNHNPDPDPGLGDGDGWMVGNGPGFDAFALPGADGQADWAAMTRTLLGLGSEEEVTVEHHEQAQRLLADLSLQAPPLAPPADPTLTAGVMDGDRSTGAMDWHPSADEQGLDTGVWGAGFPEQGEDFGGQMVGALGMGPAAGEGGDGGPLDEQRDDTDGAWWGVGGPATAAAGGPASGAAAGGGGVPGAGSGGVDPGGVVPVRTVGNGLCQLYAVVVTDPGLAG
ncbi:hypothetical protein ACWCPY_43310, partial [Streptomyces sp. NPDC002403]